ncbi:MAG: DUF4138 domain-containing protein [Bacteroidota bacterium]
MRRLPIFFMLLTTLTYGQVSDTIQISAFYDVTILFAENMTTEPSIGAAGIQKKQIDERTLMVKADGRKMKQAGQKTLPNTNLTVHTKEGIFIFLLTYNNIPSRNFIRPTEYKPIFTFQSATQENPSIHPNQEYNEHSLLENLSNTEPKLTGIGVYDRKFKMRIEVTNIWVDSTSVYFKIVLDNYSNIPYNVNYFRYFTTYGRYSFKQQTEPLEQKKPSKQLLSDYDRPIVPDEQFTNVFIVDKFTLNKKEFFNVQVGEINGARQMTVSISREVLLTAVPIPLY